MSELSQRSTHHLCTGAVAGLGDSIDALSQLTVNVSGDAHLALALDVDGSGAGHESDRNGFDSVVSDPETHCHYLCLRFRPNLEGSMCVLDTLRLLREPNAHTLPRVVTARDLVA